MSRTRIPRAMRAARRTKGMKYLVTCAKARSYSAAACRSKTSSSILEPRNSFADGRFALLHPSRERPDCRPAIAGGKTIIDVDVATLHPTKVPKPFAKCRDAGLSFQIILGNSQQHTNPPHPVTLLCARRERPRRRRAAEQRDELASSHAGHGGVLPPLYANEGQGWFAAIHGITERPAGPWATPEMF